MKYLAFIITIFICIHTAYSNEKQLFLDSLFLDLNGSFVLFDSKDSTYFRYNPEGCSERLSPCSTFKIPNALLALQLSVISNPKNITVWDSIQVPKQRFWPEMWAKNHNLYSAMKYSVVWYFQKIARAIGKIKYRDYLKTIGYGNQDISGPVDRFWLMNSLKISANEQIEFLIKFNQNIFGFNQENINIVKNSINIENKNGSRFYGKTGAGGEKDGYYLGWLVGFIENSDNTYYYALNIRGKTFEQIIKKRLPLTKKIFEILQIY